MASKLIYQFRIELLEIQPAIWRRVLVPSEYSFWDLHVAVQDAMGWLDYHLHEFRVKKPAGRKVVAIGMPEYPADKSELPGWEVPLAAYFTIPGVRASYTYDFGDGWKHDILFEAILIADPPIKYPICVAGERACPPEDCGGALGYEKLLKALASPKTSENKKMTAWLKGHAKNYFPYKPDSFDPKGVQFGNPAKRLRMAFGKHE